MREHFFAYSCPSLWLTNVLLVIQTARQRKIDSRFVLAAQERIDELAGIPRLQITDPARDLANALMDRKAIPESEPRDALHIGIAAVHGVQYFGDMEFQAHCKRHAT